MHRREGKLIVSATDLVGFLACGHLTRLERAAVAGLIEKPIRDDPEIELLQRRGGVHEQRYIGMLEASGRQVTRLDADRDRPYEERAAETIEHMRAGTDVIYQATVFDGRWVGHPDFLLRTPGTSTLGDFHYEVSDTKLARTAKAGALIQICSYVEHVERIQGVRPEWVYVVTGGAEAIERPFRTAEMMAYYRRAKGHFEQAIDDAVAGAPDWPIGRELSYPDPVDHCQVCRWFVDFCRKQWRDDDALPLVAGISRRQRQLLTTGQVITGRALSALERPFTFEGLKRSQHDSLWRVREQARLQLLSAGQPVPAYELLEAESDADGVPVPDRGLAALPPPSEGDVFFDIEGDPFAYWEGIDYLFGIWTGQGEWHSWWAIDRAAEKVAFEALMDWLIARLDRHPEMHVYHYAPYEPTALKRLAGRHATREEEVDRLLRGRVLVDLFRVVRQGLRIGVESYSIKKLEPLYGFQREIELRDANSSIVEFENLLEVGDPSGELRAQIEAYNRDDCVSNQRLRDWLEERRTDYAHVHDVILPRPAPADEQPSEELTEREQRVLELERRLTAGVSDDPLARSPEQHATWLVGHLVDWHRRENKAAWWRFYDLMGRTDEELFDEKEPIAELTYQGVVGQTARSIIHRYTFPTGQELKVEPDFELHDPRLVGATKTGTCHAIDADAGTIDIKRNKAWTGQHPSAVVPLNMYRVPAQQAALMTIGRWVADNGIDSPLPDYRAARDLLLRRAPRLAGGAGGRLVREGEAGTRAARRLVTQLDGATLPVQGPPGSGKTYAGARMILDLVGKGRVVGITSNSHKVIAHLLLAACKAADEAGTTVRALQLCDEDELADHRFVERAKSTDAVDMALAEGRVDLVTGTSWLWSRDDMAGRIDTLFIDEAGQVALANVLAVSAAARNIVLLGDPQQLDQPTQGVHPDGAGRSALAHFLDTAEVVPDDKGIFLESTWRMHPDITRYTSELFYESRLRPVEGEGLERQRVAGTDWLAGSGLRWVPVAHDGNTNASAEEADEVARIVEALVGRDWVDRAGVTRPLTPAEIVIVSPFNAHRRLIQERLGPLARVGTVDKFQGQEAPISIYTMATSRPEEAPRGMDFLYSLNRLNVATSRAQALAIVVGSDKLLGAVPRTPDQLRMANGLCALVEMADVAPDESTAGPGSPFPSSVPAGAPYAGQRRPAAG
jgi:predicted RecB family nuclease